MFKSRPISRLPRLTTITRRVQALVRSHYDRSGLEALFKLQPRAVQLLLEALPTIVVGRAHLGEWEALLRVLKGMAAAKDPATFMEQTRREEASISRRRPRTLVRRDAERARLSLLPKSITLSRCPLEFGFRTIEDLAPLSYAFA